MSNQVQIALRCVLESTVCLHDLMQSPNKLHSAVVSRIKILANLDIAERRIPQDGRIRANILGRPIDLRVSTVPTPKGEKVVLRILDDRNIRIGLEDLGFQKETLEKVARRNRKPARYYFGDRSNGLR